MYFSNAVEVIVFFLSQLNLSNFSIKRHTEESCSYTCQRYTKKKYIDYINNDSQTLKLNWKLVQDQRIWKRAIQLWKSNKKPSMKKK